MLRLAVNVSPRQFQQKTLPQLLHTILDETGLPAHCMELEITEGMLMQSPEESTEVLRALRRLGIAIVVDDFGTGYSSLAYLTRFPIDKIKIDRSFVPDKLGRASCRARGCQYVKIWWVAVSLKKKK